MFLNFHTHQSRNPKFEIYNTNKKEIYSKTWFSEGIHPKDTQTSKVNEDLIKTTKCIAIGECGLDKLIEVPIEIQIKKFEEQILLSEKHQLPIIIHCVKAWNEIKTLKKKHQASQIWVYHGFRKTSILKEVLENDLYFGIGSAILFDERLQQALKQMPTNKILLETDDDKNVTIEDIYEKVAEIKNLSLPDLQNEILTNFKTVFKKWQNG